MPADLTILEKKGCTQEALKKLFEQSREERAKTASGEKVNKLIDLHRDRIQQGLDRNFQDARHWWAIDQAYDIGQYQVTYTLVRGLLDKKPSQEEVLSVAKDWGLTSMLTPLLDKNGKQVLAGNVPAMKLDLPTFFNIFVPFVMAYTKIRWATLYNERDLYPFYKYEPLKLTPQARLKTEIITDRIGRMTTEMGYKDDEKQSILQTLMYGVCLNLPAEDYWKEEQLVSEGGKEKKKVVREGVRFVMPHPSKVFFDQSHRPSTFNFDNGADYAGYWEVVRYGDIRLCEAYWNRDKITWGGTGSSSWPWGTGYGTYSSLYPCSIKFPSNPSGSDNNRESKAFVYGANDDDSAVNLVSILHKIVPKDWGLYDYEHPVWHRFVYSGDDTVIHCVPLAYSPVVAYLYDYDNNRSRNASLSSELLPWQDHIGNLLSQYILSVKKNLTRVVMFNRDVLDDSDVREIVNLGEKMYRDFKMIPYSGKELSFAQTGPGQAFFPVQFQAMNTGEIVAAINTTLGMMERVLGFSSQELAAQASHEQSATEVRVISQNTSVRMQFTGSFIDQAIWAKKRLLYDAMMAYSDDTVFAEVTDLDENKRSDIEKLGFKIEDEDSGGTRAGIRGSKKALTLEGFASEREGVNRINDAKIAATMLQTFQSIFANQRIVDEAGIKQIFDMFNQIMPYMGVPKDFKLRFNPDKTGKQNAEEAQNQLQQLTQMVAGISKEIVGKEFEALGDSIRSNVVEPIAKQQQETQQAIKMIAEKDAQQDQALQLMAQKIKELMQAAEMIAQEVKQTQQAVTPQPVPVPVPVPAGAMPLVNPT